MYIYLNLVQLTVYRAPALLLEKQGAFLDGPNPGCGQRRLQRAGVDQFYPLAQIFLKASYERKQGKS